MIRFFTLLFLFSTYILSAQNAPKTTTLNRWQADSLLAVNKHIPLVLQSDSSTFTFMNFDGKLPMYSTPTTLGEVESYKGQQLWIAPFLLDGNTQTIGMWEAFSGVNALPNNTNGNLLSAGSAPSRITLFDAGTTSGHATNVALRLAGDGLSGSSHQGVGPQLKISAWNITNLFDELKTNAHTLVASNHSYAYVNGYTAPISGVNWYAETNVSIVEDFKFGRYSKTEKSLDSIAFHHPYHSIVLAAGNDRGSSQAGTITGYYTADGSTYIPQIISPAPPADGGADGFDCIPLGANGKNTLTVGACAIIPGGYSVPTDVVVSAQSCFGPTDDGRIKPDFIAPATGGFTSYSTPQVSGSIALLQELSLRERGTHLHAATIKALLAHTAFDAGNTGPDYKHGWGLINPEGAAELIIDQSGNSKINEASLNDGEESFYLIYADGTNPITATLSWTDPESMPVARTFGPSDLDNSTPMLVNDLDMRLVDFSNTVVAQPYILDPINPANVASTGDNFRDNTEKIFLAAPSAGWYAIRVNQKSTLASPQDFSLIISGAKGAECAGNLPSIDNEWNGSSWSNTFSDGQNVIVNGTLSLVANTSFGHAVLSPNTEVNIGSGVTLEIEGDVQSFENVVFNGDGELQLSGSSQQLWCGGAQINRLVIQNSNGVQLNSSPLSVVDWVDLQAGELTTNGNLTLVSSPGNYAQIHEDSGTISGEIEYQQTITSNGWHYLSSPVNTTIGDLLEEMNTYNLTETDGSIYSWNATSGAWTPPLDTTLVIDVNSTFNTFFGTSGTHTFSPIPFTIKLRGEPNSGAVNNTVVYGPSTAVSTAEGWNLIANPYPENLDWNTIKANFGLANIDGAYSIWDARSNTYKIHNGLTGDAELSGKIAPMQAFFVKLNDASAEATTAFNFTNANRVLGDAQFLKTAPVLLNLFATQSKSTDRFYLAFQEGATMLYDDRKDGYKLVSPAKHIAQLFQPISGEMSLAINNLPQNFGTISLPLQYTNSATGTATIGIDSSSIPVDWRVILEDTKTNVKHNLLAGNYPFQHKQNANSARFILHLIQRENPSEKVQFLTWVTDGKIRILMTNEIQNATVSIYSITGQKIAEQHFSTLVQTEIPVAKNGVYLVHMTTKNGEEWVEKVVR